MQYALWRRRKEEWLKDNANKSRVYLPPMLGVSPIVLAMSSLMNAYIGDTERPIYKDHILLQYEFNDQGRVFSKFEKIMERLNGYVATYDPDKFTTIFVYKIPDQFLKDYQLYLEGKYSKFSDEYKKAILDFADPRERKGIQMVFDKDPLLRKCKEEYLGSHIPEDMELASIIDLHREVYGEHHKIVDPIFQNFSRYLSEEN